VDRYRPDYKTYILISRRGVKNKGDVDEFNIEWSIRQGFLRRTEQWETHVTHRTRRRVLGIFVPRMGHIGSSGAYQAIRTRTPAPTVVVGGHV